MRIIYVLQSFQHPKVRGPLRHYYFIRELSRRHRITLLVHTREDIPPDALEEMASYTEQLFLVDSRTMAVPALLGAIPRLKRLWQHYCGTIRDMRARLDALSRSGDYDLVFFHGTRFFSVIKRFSALPIVADVCDADSMRLKAEVSLGRCYQRPLRALRRMHYRRYEKGIVAKTRHLAFISARDRDYILGAGSRAHVIPLGVDLQYWTRTAWRPGANCLIFTGVMDYPPNEDAALYLIGTILPLVCRQIPDVTLVIAGRNPTERLLTLAASRPEVTVTGFVEDMRQALSDAVVFVAPLRMGAGMQTKLQEALAMELPIVTTSLAAAGLKTESGAIAPLYVADDPVLFASRIVDLLENASERARLAREGRLFVEKHYIWRECVALLEQLFAEALR